MFDFLSLGHCHLSRPASCRFSQHLTILLDLLLSVALSASVTDFLPTLPQSLSSVSGVSGAATDCCGLLLLLFYQLRWLQTDAAAACCCRLECPSLYFGAPRASPATGRANFTQACQNWWLVCMYEECGKSGRNVLPSITIPD